jgi:hypothetical protein
MFCALVLALFLSSGAASKAQSLDFVFENAANYTLSQMRAQVRPAWPNLTDCCRSARNNREGPLCREYSIPHLPAE